MKKLMIAVLAVALLATSGVVMAQGWGGGPGMGRGPGMGMGYGPNDPGYGPRGPGDGPGAWGSRLNLSAEQTQKMQALRAAFFMVGRQGGWELSMDEQDVPDKNPRLSVPSCSSMSADFFGLLRNLRPLQKVCFG